MGKHTVKVRSLQPGDVVDGMRLIEVAPDTHEMGTIRVKGRPLRGDGAQETRYWPASRLVEVERKDR